MGRVTGERKIHFTYTPEFIEHWNEQTPEFREMCNELGRLHGYSGHNIFYTFYLLHHAHIEAKKPFKDYRSAL